MLVKVMGSYAALYLFKIHAFYPCCGRIAASLRGPNPIKLLCSFGANAGICGLHNIVRAMLQHTYCHMARGSVS